MEKYLYGFLCIRENHASLESLPLLYNETGNQENLVQESRMSRVRKEKL